MRALREDGRTINISAEIQRAADERVREFKQRLIRDVARICCDVPNRAPTGQEWNVYMDSLSVDELKTLCTCFRLELRQVIFALKEAK